MKRIYVIVPKKLQTKPPTEVGCGFGMAQVHHATVKASKRFKMSHRDTVVVLQVPDTKALTRWSKKLKSAGIKFDTYRERSSLFEGEAVTALVTNVQPGRMAIFDSLDLWCCE